MDIKGYKTSTDYELLWELIQQGYRVVGWIDRVNSEFKHTVVVEVKKQDTHSRYTIGTLGCGYEDTEQTLESFAANCKYWNLRFVNPSVQVEPTEGFINTSIQQEHRILSNVSRLIPPEKRKAMPNWKLVMDCLLMGTGASGKTSSYEKCKELGVDPDGYSI